ncbi:MAG: hypothetical protein ACOC8B_00430, partial [Gemmatimonadota bacterium]
VLSTTTMQVPAPRPVAPGPSWRHDAAYDRLPVDGRHGHMRQAQASPRLSDDDDPHPLRGALATIGGMLAGFGVGLATDEPAAGLFVGTGVGMITTTIVRAFDD